MAPERKARPREYKGRPGRAGGRASEYHHLYGHRWRKERATFLKLYPLCVMCQDMRVATAATEVDHKTPHRGDEALFWDTDNWQGLCKPHHDKTKAEIERRGYATEIGLDGWPIDKNHPVNRPRD